MHVMMRLCTGTLKLIVLDPCDQHPALVYLAVRIKMASQSYHHGDLRNELIKAAEQQLRDAGIERFSLRSVARTAGVSHAAPAHHFSDTQGLLTSLATVGFERFLHSQIKKQDAAGTDPIDRRAAAGLAYIEFTERNPELFHLMFSSQQPDWTNPELKQAANNAFSNLVMLVNAVKGIDSDSDQEHITDVYATWALVHGLSSLTNAGMLASIKGGKKSRQEMIKKIINDNLSV